MVSVPFLLIPQLCQLEILKKLPSVDIVLLSLTSTRVKNVVKLCKRKVDAEWKFADNKLFLGMYFEVDGLEVIINHCNQNAWNSLLLSFLTQERDRGCFQLPGGVAKTMETAGIWPAHQHELSYWSISNFSVFGHRTWDARINLYTKDLPHSITSKEMTRTIVDHLLEAFPFESNSVEIYGLKNAHALDCVLQLSKVKWVEFITKSLQNVSIVKNFLGDPNVEEFVFNSVIKKRFEYNLSLNPEKFKVQNASWVNINCLMDMNCSTVELSGHKFTSEEINAFLQHWKRGGYDKLRFLELRNGTKTFDMDIVMSGISEFTTHVRTATSSSEQRKINLWRAIIRDPLFEAKFKRDDGRTAAVFWKPPLFLLIILE